MELEAILADTNLWTSVLLVYWPGFVLGLLHSCVPSHEQNLFVFYTYGVSRSTKEAFRIVGSYSSGTLLSNIGIGSIITLIGGLLLRHLDPLISNQIGSLVLITVGIYLLIQVSRKKIRPHANFNTNVVKKFQENGANHRSQTGFLIGLVAGLTPSLFEVAIFTYAASIGIVGGLIFIAFYSVGALTGMLPSTLFSIQRVKKKKLPKQVFGMPKISKIEVLSAILLLIVGIMLFSIAFAGVDLFSSVHPQV